MKSGVVLKKFFVKIFLAAVFAVPLSFSAHAQEIEKDPFEEDPFGQMTLRQNELNYSSNVEALDPNRLGFKEVLSGKMKSESDATEADKLRVDRLRVGTSMSGAMSSSADGMYSKVLTNQLSHFLGSPRVLYNATMQLTEPAVAAAVHNSSMEVNGVINNLLLSEQNFIMKLDKDPDTRLIVLREYDDCVTNIIRPLGEEEDKATWFEAASRCMRDRAKNLEAILPSKNGGSKNYDVISPNGVTGEGFDFTYDMSNPLAPKYEGEGGGTGGGSGGTPGASAPPPTDKLLLTDMIFDKNSSSNVDEAELDRFKESFRMRFGDYEIKLDKAGDIASAARSLEYTLIPPDKDAKAKFFGEKAEFTFKTINTLLIQRCEYSPGGNDSLTSTPTFCASAGNKNNNQAAGGNSLNLAKAFRSLSFLGYEFDCAMLEGLFLSFTYDNPDLLTYSNANSGNNQNNQQNGQSKGRSCEQIFDQEYGKLVEANKKAANGGNSNAGGGLPGGNNSAKMKGGYEYVFKLSELITMGHLFQMVDNTSVKVEELTGSNKRFALNLAHKLIREYIGGGDLNTMLSYTVNNIREIKAKIDNINDVKGGQGLTTLYNN